eukprot:6193786-Pleurochrysis_carterae.AAC.5
MDRTVEAGVGSAVIMDGRVPHCAQQSPASVRIACQVAQASSALYEVCGSATFQNRSVKSHRRCEFDYDACQRAKQMPTILLFVVAGTLIHFFGEAAVGTAIAADL